MGYLETHIKTETAVLIPCLNEEKTIVETCSNFKLALPDALVCVGDNNSTDRTAELAMAEPSCNAVVRCPVPGKGAATRTMLEYIDADWYLTVDGDLTYDHKIASSLLHMARRTNGIATGARILSNENQPLLHQPGNKLVDFLVGLKYRTKIKDVMSGYRAIPGWVLKGFCGASPYDGFEIETALAMYALSRNVPISYIPCKYDDRPDGSESKLRTFRDGAKVLWAVATCRF